MEIEKVLSEEFNKIVESGFIEEKISENLKKLMESTIKDVISGYGSDFKKAIEEKLEIAMNADVRKLSIPEYHTKILSVVQDEIDIALKHEVESSLRERVKDFFQPIEDRVYKVSEIVEMYKNDIKSEFTGDYDEMYDSHEITAYTERNSSGNDNYYELYLDKESDKRKYDCELHIRINENGIWHISSGGSDLIKTKHSFLGKFERFLYQAYSQKVTIENDSDNIDNYIPSDY